MSRVRSLFLNGGLSTHAAFAIGSFCPLLQSLEFNYVKVSSTAFENMVSGCPLLQSFEAGRYTADDSMLVALGRNCPQLRSFCCERCPRLGNKGLKALAKGCKDLRELNLTRSSVSDEGVADILESCRRLAYLCLNECEGVSSAAFRRLPALVSETDACKRAQLKSLEVYYTGCDAYSMRRLRMECADCFSLHVAEERDDFSNDGIDMLEFGEGGEDEDFGEEEEDDDYLKNT